MSPTKMNERVFAKCEIRKLRGGEIRKACQSAA